LRLPHPLDLILNGTVSLLLLLLLLLHQLRPRARRRPWNILGVEHLQEVLLDISDLLLLLQVLLNVIDLESRLQVVPLLIWLVLSRTVKNLLQLEFLVKVLEILVER